MPLKHAVYSEIKPAWRGICRFSVSGPIKTPRRQAAALRPLTAAACVRDVRRIARGTNLLNDFADPSGSICDHAKLNPS
jgi:hypothetical protein